jgi:hypothetical protein
MTRKQNFRKETVYSNLLIMSYEQSGHVYVSLLIALNNMSKI